MASGHSHPIQLDLTRQKLLVKPDDRIPQFYPPPHRVMVTPIYDNQTLDDSSSSASYQTPEREHRHHAHETAGGRHRHRYTKSHSQNRGVYTDSESEDPRSIRSASHGRYYAPSTHSYEHPRSAGDYRQHRDPYSARDRRYSDEDEEEPYDDRPRHHHYSDEYSARGDEREYGHHHRIDRSPEVRHDDYGYDSPPRERYRDPEYPPSSSDSEDYDDQPYEQAYSGRTRSRPEGTGPSPEENQGHGGGPGYPQSIGGGPSHPHGNGQGQYAPSGGGAQQQTHPSYSHGSTHSVTHGGSAAHDGGGLLQQAAGEALSYAAGRPQSQGHGHGYIPSTGGGAKYQVQPSHSQGSGAHGGGGAIPGAFLNYVASHVQSKHPEFSAVTHAFLQYAQRKGVFDNVSRYMEVLPPSRDFCWSKCTGRKKAVCIGINYVGQKDELKGCANDARNMRDFLINMYHFDPQQIVLITDERQYPTQLKPTRREMLNAMSWLVKDAHPNDSLFFHYSGHGGQSPDASGREADGMDEVIFPLDYDQTDDIIDDELHQALIPPLPAGCRLTAIFDSCHSGTVLDLPYLHSAHGRLRGMSHISKRAQNQGVAPCADVISFSACKDDETSADTREGGVAVGAMSYAFIESLKNNPHQTYEELLTNLRHVLIPKYHQKAQISGTHPLDLDRQFTL